MKNRKVIKLLLVAVCFVAAGVVFSCAVKKQSGTEGNVVIEEVSKEAETESMTERLVCVHVCGSVATPGVYYLEEGSRIHEAVELAGGLTEEAAGQSINLAETLKDGEQIYIPSLEEMENGYEMPTDGLVNINTAEIDELKTLPGIGDIKAEAIISYRESNGDFSNIQEITNVEGIKDSSYEKIKDYIKV
ncbi:MAG: helix-hairpin-helix domain-containing protein [Lachnospiraceae bacterium]|nr:helix-hairpin-helix domain-containing protein [Lachnospiraceae bacterium]